jgi:glycosyltransferase involved in cell wall biosynthesis
MKSTTTRKAILLGDISESGGTGTYFERAMELLAAEFELHIVLRKEQDSPWLRERLAKNAYSYSIDYALFGKFEVFIMKAFSKLGFGLPYTFFREHLFFRRLCKKYRPDLIFISQGGGVKYFTAFLYPVPVVIVSHSLFTSPITNAMWGFSFLKHFNSINSSKKRLIQMSGFAENLYKKNIHNASLARISTVVPNYGTAYTVRPRFDKKINILTIGHVTGYKNPQIWIEVARRLECLFPGRLTWTWAGNGPDLREFMMKTENDSNIAFIGFQKDVSKIYASCDIYFQPSIWESQGISVVDAMASSIPCIVSNAGGLPESIRDGIEGFVCDALSVDSYIDAFKKLIDDPLLRREMGERAKKRFLERFSREEWRVRMKKLVSTL